MTTLHFTKNITEKNVHVDQDTPAIFADASLVQLNVTEYPIGTDGSDVRDMLDKVEQGKRADINVPTEFGTMKAVVRSYWVHNPNAAIDFNNDGKKDALLLRTATIPQEGNKSVTTSWLVAVLDDGDMKISPDEEKDGIVIASGASITGVKIGDHNSDGLTDVSFTKLDQRTKQYDTYTATATTGTKVPDAKGDRELILSAMAFYDPFVQATETAYAKKFIIKDFGKEAELVEPSKGSAITDVLRPLYKSLKETKELPKWTTLLLRKFDSLLKLSSSEMKYRSETLGELTKQFMALSGKLEWNGKKISQAEYENMISEETGDVIRNKMVENYESTFAPVIAEGGAYHQFVEKMNGIAKAHGYKNYAELRIFEKFGMNIAEFKTWVDDVMKATSAEAKKYIDGLRTVSGKQNIGYWGAGYFKKAWLRNMMDGASLPELSSDEALNIAKIFFKDIGFDMSKAPYDKITMDPFADPLKFELPGVAVTATTKRSYFSSNIKPDKKIPLGIFEIITHEMAHTLHYRTSEKFGEGYSSYQNSDAGYSYVFEAIAAATQDLLFATPELVKKYFGKVEGYSDKFANAYPLVKKVSGAWETRKLLAMALLEVNMYESEEPWNERSKVWSDLVKDKLFVEPEGQGVGQILFRRHPFAEQTHLAYANYSLPQAALLPLRSKIKHGTQKELASFGNSLKQVMAKGALADRKTLQDAAK